MLGLRDYNKGISVESFFTMVKVPEVNRRKLLARAVLAISLVLPIGLAGCFEEKTPAQKNAENCLDSAYHWVHATDFVEGYLTYPAGADFQFLGSQNARQVGQARDCTMQIASYVDAPNGFGVSMRIRFWVTTRYEGLGPDGYGRFSLLFLKMDSAVLVDKRDLPSRNDPMQGISPTAPSAEDCSAPATALALERMGCFGPGRLPRL